MFPLGYLLKNETKKNCWINMPFWDYIHIGSRPPHHNLQEGLFQIASQTCSILVQVNNTNNISYGNNSTNVQYNNFAGHCSSSTSGTSNSDASRSRYSSSRSASFREQSEVLIPSTSVVGNATKNLFNHYKHRLSVRNFHFFFFVLFLWFLTILSPKFD